MAARACVELMQSLIQGRALITGEFKSQSLQSFALQFVLWSFDRVGLVRLFSFSRIQLPWKDLALLMLSVHFYLLRCHVVQGMRCVVIVVQLLHCAVGCRGNVFAVSSCFWEKPFEKNVSAIIFSLRKLWKQKFVSRVDVMTRIWG